VSWETLSTLPPLRDEHGTIVLEEADDDTRTATFRVYGRRRLTATVIPSGGVRFSGEAPAILRDALPPAPEPVAGGRTLRWVVAGAACAGVAALAARRRR
jgi:hypothetical protein